MTSKTQLELYIDYYKSLTKPGYAILVTGNWGAGKTYQVKLALRNDEYYYVSLFGITKVEEIHRKITALAWPYINKAQGYIKLSGTAVGSIGGFFSPLKYTPNIVDHLLANRVEPDKILIFDDLERCELKPKEMLGAINQYLEHRGFKVILISHDELISDDYKEIKEKLIGQSFKVSPSVESALTAFINEYEDVKFRDFLTQKKNLIKETFISSKVMSLRILRQTIMDLNRFQYSITEKHRESEALNEILKLFIAFSLEIRSNRLNKEDIETRENAILKYHMTQKKDGEGAEKPRIMVSSEKYIDINLYSTDLTDEILIATLINGHYESEKIRETLNNSSHFISPSEADTWKIVINFDELEDEVVDKAVEKMEHEFASRNTNIEGEMLHIFSLRLLLSENNIIKKDMAEITTECISYIEDLLNENRLQFCLPVDRERHNAYTAYDGIGYWITDQSRPHFDQITSKLKSSKKEAINKKSHEFMSSIIQNMHCDPREVIKELSISNLGESRFYNYPILNACAPKEFVDQWLNSPKQNWRLIQIALNNRYSHGALDGHLAQENEWAQSIYNQLLERSKANGLQGLRIKRIIPEILRSQFNHNDEPTD